MRMPRQSHGHPVRHLWKNIRLMRHQDNRRLVGDLRQGSRQIVKADARSDLIGKARQPKPLAILLKTGRPVLVDRHVDRGQRLMHDRRPRARDHRVGVVDPIMVSHHRVNAKRRCKAGKLACPFA